MRAPGATLRKVVLSPARHGRPERPARTCPPCCAACAPAEPTCTVFSMPVPDGTFFGASPELLVARHGRRVTCHPLAGTVARGDTARADADAQRAWPARPRTGRSTASSSTTSRPRSRPCATSCSCPKRRRWWPSAPWPTWAPGSREPLRPTRPVLELLDRLHPTPAVGGTPASRGAGRDRRPGRGGRRGLLGRAGGLGRRDRGRGVDDRHPQRPPARRRPRLSLRAGAGIVAGSDPDAEAAETDVKLATVLETVLPGAFSAAALSEAAVRCDGRASGSDRCPAASGRRRPAGS